MIYGYARVSTEDQKTHAQTDALTAAGCAWIFEEKRSGGNMNRPELLRMLDMLQTGDTVVVYKMDRIARSLRDLMDIQERIHAAGAQFKSLTESIDTTTPVGRFIFQVIGSFAELERAIIRERTIVGLRAAMARGSVPGRRSVLHGQERKVLELRTAGHTLEQIGKRFGVHISSVKRALSRA